MSEDKYCIGCGIKLQDENMTAEGYTTSIENDICSRCFKMKNYGDYQVVTKSNDEYINILKSVNDTKDLVVYIIDLLNISRDINLIREYFDNKVLLVLNKRDILPKSIKDEKIKEYFAKLGLDYEGFCDVVQINEWKLELMFSVLLKNLIKNKDKLRTIAKTAIESSALGETVNNEILNEIKEINIKLSTNKSRLDKLLNAYLDNMLTNEEYSSKRKELEDTIITLENRLKELEENSKNQSISVKDKINILKQKVDMLLDIDTNEISDVLIDSIVDKITVHNDRYEWKINYISSSSEENDENSNGVFFARMIITVDEIKRYNDKKRILKKVFQKDPIVMDIYI